MAGPHPPIAARRLRAVLEQPVSLADEIGGASLAFAPLATLWVALDPVAGTARSTERSEADQAGQCVTYRLSLRWRGDVNARMRFRAGSRLFNILGTADPDGRRRTLVCLVEEVAP